MYNNRFSVKSAFLICLAIIAICLPLTAANAQPLLPKLYVNPDTVTFYAYFCEDTLMPQNPLIQGFIVGNIGDDNMTWTGSADAPWVVFEPPGGGNFDSVAVWVDWDQVSLPFTPPQPGDTIYYESTITIDAGDAEDSPQFVTVRLGFYCPSNEINLIVEPDLVEVTLPAEATYSDWFYVSEAEGAVVLFYFYNNSNWLFLPETFAPLYTPDSVEFVISTADLSPGFYVDTIFIVAGEQEPLAYAAIPVHLNVTDGGFYLAALPEAYNFVVPQGEPILGESLYVYELSDQAINFVTYNYSYWIYIDTMEASPLYTPELLFVDFYTDTLMPGTYFDTILVYADEAVNSPFAIPVSVTVQQESPDYEISTTPRYFDLSLPVDTQVDKAFTVYEVQGRNIPFVVSEISSWLTINNISSVQTPSEVQFSVSTVDMQPGVYADTFFIFPDTDGVPFSPKAVAVFLQVQGDMAVVIAEPDNFSFNLNAGDTLVNNSIFVYEQQAQNILFATEVLNNSPWLQLQYDSLWTQTTPSTVFFDICTGGLGAGIYVDTIVVFYPLDDIYGFDDVIIPVTLTVNGDSLPYELRAEPMSFNFQLQPGESAYDTLFVYEANDRMIGFYYFNGADWLVVNPLGMPPFVTPMPLPVAISTNQLDVGLYIDTIFVNSDFEPGYPQTLAIPVYLTVGGAYMAGDANADEEVNIGDALYIVNYIFRYGPPPEPLYAADVDCNGLVNVGDVVNIINYIFREGPGLGCH